MQSPGNFRIAIQKNSRKVPKKSLFVCFMVDGFLVFFSNSSEQLIQGRPLDGCYLKVFCSMEAVAQKCYKSCSGKSENISEESVRWDIYFFILANKTTPSLMISWEFCEFFWNSCFKEHFLTAASEIIWESYCSLLEGSLSMR